MLSKPPFKVTAFPHWLHLYDTCLDYIVPVGQQDLYQRAIDTLKKWEAKFQGQTEIESSIARLIKKTKLIATVTEKFKGRAYLPEIRFPSNFFVPELQKDSPVIVRISIIKLEINIFSKNESLEQKHLLVVMQWKEYHREYMSVH